MSIAPELTSQARVEALRQQARSLSRSLILPHAPERLWPLLSNTDMINALSALPALRILPGQSDGKVTVDSSDLGLPMRYCELPYEWTRPAWLRVERIFTKGVTAYLRFEARLEPEGENATRAELSLAIVPKLPWLVLRPRLQQILDRLARSYQTVAARLSAQENMIAAEAFGQDPARHAARIEMLREDWLPLTNEPALAKVLAEHVCCAPDRYVSRMRPFELARRHGFDRIEALRFFLRATREGYLNLSWDLLCPSCQGAKGRASSLIQLDPSVHCESCGIDFTGRFDENFELTFNPVRTLREVHEAAYCAGSPANTGHVSLQRNLWPGQTLELALDLAPGAYRFRALGLSGTQDFRIDPQGLPALALALSGNMADEDLLLAPGCRLALTNATERFLNFKIEDLAWREERVSAALVSTMQDFRDMFSSEVLRPGVNLAVSNLTVMFTDLKDSTLMYEVQGDAHAFSLVQDHFEIMQELIREAGGGIVKTIGDAVMAVFQEPAQAMACSLDIQREFRQWNREWYRDDPDRRAIVKIGLHRGPCIALNLNDKLDYFGSTINKAARIQGESVGEDIVISDDMLAADGVLQLLLACDVQRFEKNLKGLSGTATLYRIYLKEPEAETAEAESSEVPAPSQSP